MIRVKDTYISSRDIMSLELETETVCVLYGENYTIHRLIVTYFNGCSVRIGLNTEEEYEEACKAICRDLEIIEARRNE